MRRMPPYGWPSIEWQASRRVLRACVRANKAETARGGGRFLLQRATGSGANGGRWPRLAQGRSGGSSAGRFVVQKPIDQVIKIRGDRFRLAERRSARILARICLVSVRGR